MSALSSSPQIPPKSLPKKALTNIEASFGDLPESCGCFRAFQMLSYTFVERALHVFIEFLWASRQEVLSLPWQSAIQVGFGDGVVDNALVREQGLHSLGDINYPPRVLITGKYRDI